MEQNRLQNSIRNTIRQHRRPIVYLGVGVLLFVIDYTVTLFAYHILKLGPGASSAIGFCTSFIVGFTLNKRVVFAHTASSRFSLYTQVALYLSLACFNLVVTSLAVDYFVLHGVKIEIMKPVVVILAACWNYFILGRGIFAHRDTKALN